MMKVLVLLHFFISYAWANQVIAEKCIDQGRKHNDFGLLDVQRVDMNCFFWVESNVTSLQTQEFESEKLRLSVKGYKNLLYITREVIKDGEVEQTYKNLITGRSSELYNILAITISPDGENIAVLNEIDSESEEGSVDAKEIHIFNSSRNGNVGSHKLIRNESIDKASLITYNLDGSEIFIAQKTESRIISIASNTSIRFARESKKPKILVDLDIKQSGVGSVDAFTFDKSGALIILDGSTQKILAYDLDAKESNNITPLWELLGAEIGISNITEIQIDPISKELVIVDQFGSEFELKSE